MNVPSRLTNSSGVIFPYILFIIAMVSLLLFHVTGQVVQETALTEAYLEQFVVESIFQMSREQVLDDLMSDGNIDTFSYLFEQGEAIITIYSQTELYLEIEYKVQPAQSETVYNLVDRQQLTKIPKE